MMGATKKDFWPKINILNFFAETWFVKVSKSQFKSQFSMASYRKKFQRWWVQRSKIFGQESTYSISLLNYGLSKCQNCILKVNFQWPHAARNYFISDFVRYDVSQNLCANFVLPATYYTVNFKDDGSLKAIFLAKNQHTQRIFFKKNLLMN